MACDKESFDSEKSATKRLKTIWTAPNKGRKPIRYYTCELCGKLHLTSKTRL
jgi:uncharacterized protein YlaI